MTTPDIAEARRLAGELNAGIVTGNLASGEVELRVDGGGETLDAAADQLRALADELERLRADGIHSCHPGCTRSGCVNDRLRKEVERLRAKVAQAQAQADANAQLVEIVQRRAARVAPAGWKLVPEMPTEEMWGELARDIVWWLYGHSAPHYGSKLHRFLESLGRDIPEWLAKEIPKVDHSPAKGTVAVCIYRAMLEAAPAALAQQAEPLMLNGLTEAETSATASVAGLTTPSPSLTVGERAESVAQALELLIGYCTKRGFETETVSAAYLAEARDALATHRSHPPAQGVDERAE